VLTFIIALLAGALTGVLSSWGIGGGTLLVLYMTALAGVEQRAAQGINLLFFVPVSLTALQAHIKNKLIEKTAALSAILAGVPIALTVSLLTSNADGTALRKIFGAFVTAVGVLELFRKQKESK
jgi:uncharacterized membrane protein YfcA